MPYARPDALVGTDWLAAHLGDPHIRVVDASFKLPGITPTAREDYDRGHIPGVVFFDIDDIAQPGTSLPHMIPPPDLFARKMEALGIGDDDRVVVYDSVGLSSAGRAWWMLRMFGHHDVAVLDGGLPKWKAGGAAGAGRRCPRRGSVRRHGRGNPARAAPWPYSGQPQPALRPGHRPADSPAAQCRRTLRAVPRCRRRARPADQNDLRFRRHRLCARCRGALQI